MKHILNQNFWKGCVKTTLLLGFMVFISSASQAQSFSLAKPTQGPNEIAEFKIAEKMGVPYYQLGTFSIDNAITKITQARENIKPNYINGTASAEEKFKYVYYTLILKDMTEYYIAPEITLLSQLTPALKGAQIGQGQQAAIYNATIALIQ